MSEDEEDQEIERAFAALRCATLDWSSDLINLELIGEWLRDSPTQPWSHARCRVGSAARVATVALAKARGRP